MDVADSLSVEDGFRKAVKHFGGDPPAIIVNSAGTTYIVGLPKIFGEKPSICSFLMYYIVHHGTSSPI